MLGELFAECPVDSYPSTTIDPVIDSSRYFVVKIVNGMGKSFGLVTFRLLNELYYFTHRWGRQEGATLLLQVRKDAE